MLVMLPLCTDFSAYYVMTNSNHRRPLFPREPRAGSYSRTHIAFFLHSSPHCSRVSELLTREIERDLKRSISV